MGNCVGGFKQRTRNIVWHKNRYSKSLVIAFLGLDAAGKTTIVKALQGEGAESVHQTMGFSRGEFTINKCRIIAYDLGGAERIRDIWKIYYSEIYAIVYVVDSAASSRIDENKRVVDALREHPDLMYKPILFLLNKKDLPEAIDEMAFSEYFSLHTMACENKTDIRVEGVCAVKGHAKDIDPMIVEGISWLIERVLSRYDQLNKEIETALRLLKERQAHERMQRQHRLATLANKSASDEQMDAEMEEPIATTSKISDQVQRASIPNGNISHAEPSPKQIVEAQIEPQPSTSSFQEIDKIPETRPKSVGQSRNHKRPNNKIVPEASLEEPIRSRENTIDYKVFEMENKSNKRRSPLRTKSFDSKLLFQPVHRPRLLMQNHNGENHSGDMEMKEMRQTTKHIEKDSSMDEGLST